MSTTNLRRFVVLSRLAFTDLVRQPVCLLIALASAALSIVLPLLTAHQLGQQTDLARDSALAFEFTGGAILVAFAACSTLSTETRDGTILTILSRPIGRGTFFLAKFVAVSGIVALFVASSTGAALAAERMTPRYFETDWFGVRLLLAVPVVTIVPAAVLNWRSGRSVPAWAWAFLLPALAVVVLLLSRFDTDGHPGRLGQFLDWRLVPAAVMVGVGLMILAALALGLAAHLPLAPTATILLALLFAGLVSGYAADLLGRFPPADAVVRTLLPDLQRFWPADNLAGGAAFGWRSVGTAALYGLVYISGVLCLGMAAFRHRQF
jgi:hypothetical protein